MENIIEKLKKLKTITPDEGYSKKSLAFILNSPKARSSRLFEISLLWQKTLVNLKLSATMVAIFAFAVIILISALYINSVVSPLILPGLNTSNISAEAQQINESINIQLQEINYYQKSENLTQNTLEQITETTTLPDLPSEQQIDKLLEELIR